ncbi:uncharacterized protein LOC142564795 [Dermacentor variabilis]|uniref:uncharacterized protein LOC142564795 n=1 Tax=Dermacentor variabilis TaxID=34621 RepID=UPI003F5BF18D
MQKFILLAFIPVMFAIILTAKEAKPKNGSEEELNCDIRNISGCAYPQSCQSCPPGAGNGTSFAFFDRSQNKCVEVNNQSCNFFRSLSECEHYCSIDLSSFYPSDEEYQVENLVL